MTPAVVRRIRVGALSATLCALATSVSGAQALEPPPDPASLASASEPQGRQHLDATVTALGTYDGLVTAAASPGSLQQTGAEYGLQSGLGWGKRTRRAVFTLSDGVALRYLPALTNTVGIYQGAAAGVTLQLARTRIALRQTAVTSPFYSVIEAARPLDETAVDVPVPAYAADVTVRNERTLSSRLDVAQTLGRRTEVALSSRYDDTVFAEASDRQLDLDLGGQLTHRLTEGLGLVLGYRHEQASYRFASQLGTQVTIVRTLETGFDYRHDLRIIRRTSVHATSGVAQLQETSQSHQYAVVGSGGLTRQFGRTWYATVNFVRGTRFIAGVQAPMFSNSASISIVGALNRHVDLLIRSDYSAGRLEIVTGGHRTEIDEASARLRFALSRRLSSSAEYLFNRYRFNRSDVLAAGLPPYFNGSAVRLRFDVALPLLH